MLDVIERYGSDHAALVAAFPTYKTRGAIRDLGKALALPAGRDRAHGPAGRLMGPDRARAGGGAARPAGCTPLEGVLVSDGGDQRPAPPPSQHSGGMVISTTPLVELVPVIPAAMEGRQICQWDKDSCADAGFLKIDLLGLGMLSAVEECVDLIAQSRGAPIDLCRVGFDDPEVYAEIRAADTVGVFQIESRAQMQSLVQTQTGEPRRPDGAGGAGAARPDRGRCGQPVHQAPPRPARRSRSSSPPTTTRCWSRC